MHHIELLPNTQPIHSAPYHLHPEKREFLRKELDNLLQQGIIEESKSLWASPIVMVPKSDGTLRLCTDFRKVNAVTVPHPFPLTRVEDLLDRVGQARYLTKLDMTRGYWQVLLDGESVRSHLGVCHTVWPLPMALHAVRATQRARHLLQDRRHSSSYCMAWTTTQARTWTTSSTSASLRGPTPITFLGC